MKMNVSQHIICLSSCENSRIFWTICCRLIAQPLSTKMARNFDREVKESFTRLKSKNPVSIVLAGAANLV